MVLCGVSGCAVSHEQKISHTSDLQQDLTLASLPSIDKFKVDPYITAAEHFQKMERKTALQELQKLAQGCDFERQGQFAILCRMLFTNRPGASFERCAGLGAPGSLSDKGPLDYNDDPGYKMWPLEPIEIIDGIPFAIVTGYSYQGYWDPSDPEKYLDYCIRECDWSKTQFTAKSREEKVLALKKLLASPKWKGSFYDRGTLYRILAEQID